MGLRGVVPFANPNKPCSTARTMVSDQRNWVSKSFSLIDMNFKRSGFHFEGEEVLGSVRIA